MKLKAQKAAGGINKMSDRLALIKRYQETERALKAAAEYGRPVCPVLAGNLVGLAEQLGVTRAAQELLDELQEQLQRPPGPFSGVTGQ